MGWPWHLRILVGTFFGLCAALYAFVLACNPYGNLPPVLFAQHDIAFDDPGFQNPAIVRNGRFDSVIIGTSTIRRLVPAALAGVLGGHFANLGLNGATAWEQRQMADLFLRHTARPHALLVGVDRHWCAAHPDRTQPGDKAVPQWLYDENPFNDLAYLFNTRTVQEAYARLRLAIGGGEPVVAPDGRKVGYAAQELGYDVHATRKLLAAEAEAHRNAATAVAAPTATERMAWQFPALEMLEQLVGDARWQRVVVVMPPLHVTAQPAAGTLAAWRDSECKRRIAQIAARHGGPRRVVVVDFRIASPLTMADANFLDARHYRVSVADRMIGDVAAAVTTGRDDPRGDFRVLTGQ